MSVEKIGLLIETVLSERMDAIKGLGPLPKSSSYPDGLDRNSAIA